MQAKPTLWKRLRGQASRAGLVLGSLLLTLGLIEGVFRIFPDLLPEGARLRIQWHTDRDRWYVPHSYIGHLHATDSDVRARTGRPGVKTPKIDRWGFRNSWPWPKKAEIVALGDSLTFGQMAGDEQTWTFALEQALPSGHVLNLGLIGAAPQQYVRVFETFAADLSPQLVLMGIFLGNDAWDARVFARWDQSQKSRAFPAFKQTGEKRGFEGWIRELIRKSYTGAFLHEVVAAVRSGRFLQSVAIELEDGGRIQLTPSLVWEASRHWKPGSVGFQETVKAASRLHGLVRGSEAHLLVLLFPMKEQIYLPLNGTTVPDFAEALKKALKEREIPLLVWVLRFVSMPPKGKRSSWRKMVIPMHEDMG